MKKVITFIIDSGAVYTRTLRNRSNTHLFTFSVLQYTFFSLTDVEVGYHMNRCAGAGMQNVGNTCYLNSTLQALFHTPALFNYLMSGSHAKQCKVRLGSNSGFSFNMNGGSQCLICAMTQTLKDTLTSHGSVIRPSRIYEKLKTICKHMVHGRQEDAHEFLR